MREEGIRILMRGEKKNKLCIWDKNAVEGVAKIIIWKVVETAARLTAGTGLESLGEAIDEKHVIAQLEYYEMVGSMIFVHFEK